MRLSRGDRSSQGLSEIIEVGKTYDCGKYSENYSEIRHLVKGMPLKRDERQRLDEREVEVHVYLLSCSALEKNRKNFSKEILGQNIRKM